jgi:hypothetical protein
VIRTLLGKAAACPICGLVRLRRDNQTGVCGRCQARGELPRWEVPDLGADGPLLELPSSAPGAWVVRPRQVKQQAEEARELPGMRVALLRARLARPRKRSQCVEGIRPCPFVACRHHLALDVTPTGGIAVNAPGGELSEMAETCSLDVADRGGQTLSQVARALGVVKERVRQIELEALARLRKLLEEKGTNRE